VGQPLVQPQSATVRYLPLSISSPCGCKSAAARLQRPTTVQVIHMQDRTPQSINGLSLCLRRPSSLTVERFLVSHIRMTEIVMSQTPPILHGPSEKERKYDRQLRLWAASGQAALESANIFLLNSGAGTVGAETLKNLVLPGNVLVVQLDWATVLIPRSRHRSLRHLR
jgi:hypothetical protein